MNVIKNRIRDLREDLDLRQVDVADATGIDQKTLSNYETGRTSPDSYAVIRLADFFGVTTDYLLGYSSFNIRNNKDIAEKLDQIERAIQEIKKLLKR